MKQPRTNKKELFDLIARSSRILIVSGAGISTGAGIIDFRSPGGLYAVAGERYNLPYPEAIFDLNYFVSNPVPFFRLSAELLLQDIQPTRCHRFLAELEAQGRVGVLATQNIDMLHQKAGSVNVVECHGSYRTARCMQCSRSYTFEEYSPHMLNGVVPHCTCGGVIKPDVVFFGENLPRNFIELYDSPPEADLVLVLGTSLTVYPVAGFAIENARRLPSILVNRDPTGQDHLFDYIYQGNLDTFAAEAIESESPEVPH